MSPLIAEHESIPLFLLFMPPPVCAAVVSISEFLPKSRKTFDNISTFYDLPPEN